MSGAQLTKEQRARLDALAMVRDAAPAFRACLATFLHLVAGRLDLAVAVVLEEEFLAGISARCLAAPMFGTSGIFATSHDSQAQVETHADRETARTARIAIKHFDQGEWSELSRFFERHDLARRMAIIVIGRWAAGEIDGVLLSLENAKERMSTGMTVELNPNQQARVEALAKVRGGIRDFRVRRNALNRLIKDDKQGLDGLLNERGGKAASAVAAAWWSQGPDAAITLVEELSGVAE